MLINSEISPGKIIANADLAELYRIRQYSQNIAMQFGFSEEDAYKISLAIDEACSNIIRHAYKMDASKEFAVEIGSFGDDLIIQIYDYATAFSPLSAPKVNMEEYLKTFKRGGLGIHIIRKVMDALEYFPSQEQKAPNILRLIKSLPKA